MTQPPPTNRPPRTRRRVLLLAAALVVAGAGYRAGVWRGAIYARAADALATTPATTLAAQCLEAGEDPSVRVALQMQLLQQACNLDAYARLPWLPRTERNAAREAIALIADYFKEFPLRREPRTAFETEGLRILAAVKPAAPAGRP